MLKINKVLISMVIFFFSCNTLKKILPTDILYTDFKQQQQNWVSPEGKISYVDRGQGTPILLLHGIPTSGWLYRKMIDPLVAQGYRVIVPDMLGFGNSDSPKGYDIYDKKAHAIRILGLMEYLKIPNWHHVTHDAGGLWTWELQQINPEKINRLTLLNTIIYKEGFKPPVELNDNGLAKLIKWSYESNTDLMVCKLFKGGLDSFKMSEADTEGYKEPLKKGKTDALHKFFTTNTESIPDYSEALKSVNAPTQVIWGIKDEILKWEPQSERVIKDLKIELENIHLLHKNHFLQEESSGKLVEIISSFKPKTE